MIFVVTGVHEHGFNRLVQAIDELACRKIINSVFIQTGFSTYKPRYCKWLSSIDYEEFEENLNIANIVVSHGGAGCIAGALERNKPIVVVPRLKKYDEHNNDHQLELTSVLEKSGRILAVYDINNLQQTIKEAEHFKPKPPTGNNNIPTIIKEYLVNITN